VVFSNVLPLKRYSQPAVLLLYWAADVQANAVYPPKMRPDVPPEPTLATITECGLLLHFVWKVLLDQPSTAPL